MKPEELLTPRVRCKGSEKFHFPNSPFEAGEILEVVQDGARLISPKTGNSVDWLKYKKYPHLFEEVSWWEERKAEDMPKWIKYKLGGYYEVNKWDKNSVGAWLCDVEIAWFFIGDIVPLDESEYLKFKASITEIK